MLTVTRLEKERNDLELVVQACLGQATGCGVVRPEAKRPGVLPAGVGVGGLTCAVKVRVICRN